MLQHFLSLEDRARLACTCRALNEVFKHPDLWTDLDLTGCSFTLSPATLSTLLARAARNLVTLKLGAGAHGLDTWDVVNALLDGYCFNVTHVECPAVPPRRGVVGSLKALQLLSACPNLQTGAICFAHHSVADLAACMIVPPHLKLASFDGNAMASLDGLPPLVGRLRELSMRHCSLDAAALDVLVSVGVNDTLEVLDLSENNIRDGADAAWGLLVSNYRRLKTLKLSRCYMRSVSVEMGQALRDHTELTHLDVSLNFMEDEDIRPLFQALYVNASITSLDCSFNRVMHVMDLLAEAVLRGHLEVLIMGNNIIDDDGGELLCGALSDVRSRVKRLDIGYNSCTDVTLRKILMSGDATPDHPKLLKELCLSGNIRNNYDFRDLAVVIGHFGGELDVLELDSMDVDDSGVAALVHDFTAEFTMVPNLKRLSLGGNRIRNAGATALADMLRFNDVMTHLDIGDNSIEDTGAEALADMMRTNTTLVHLNLSRNMIRDRGGRALCRAKNDNVNSSLTMTGNDFLSEDVEMELALAGVRI